MTDEQLKKCVLDTVDDLVSDFSYYDRKDDELLTGEDLDRAIESGIITKEEIIQRFTDGINKIWP